MRTILFILAVQWAASALAHTSTNDTANGHAASGIIKEHFDYLNAVAEASRKSQKDLLDVAWKVGAGVAGAVAALAWFFAWLGFSTKKEVKADLKTQATTELEAAKPQWKRAVDEEIQRNGEMFKKLKSEIDERQAKLDEETKRCQDRAKEAIDATKQARRLIDAIKADRIMEKLVNDVYDALRGVDEDDSEPTRIAQTNKLQDKLKQHPGELRLAIALAHVICRDPNVNKGMRLLKAISTLQTALQSLGEPASTEDAEEKDKLTEREADARYNLACYLNAYADECLQGDQFADEREKRRESALKQLNHSCLHFPGNVEPAKIDRQLQTLINGRDWNGKRWVETPAGEPNPNL